MPGIATRAAKHDRRFHDTPDEQRRVDDSADPTTAPRTATRIESGTYVISPIADSSDCGARRSERGRRAGGVSREQPS